jgi:di/tripeptidase
MGDAEIRVRNATAADGEDIGEAHAEAFDVRRVDLTIEGVTVTAVSVG